MNGGDLRKLRERRNWSQKDLAEAINAALGRSYNSGSISPWETGKRPIPADVAAFLDELAIDTALPDEPATVEPQPGETAADTPPEGGPGTPAAPSQPVIGTSGAYTRACRELWEMIASAVGMIGAATGSPLLMADGQIIAADAPALGEAWGKLAETNATFRKMLIGMTEGGAWLQVALVTGTTASKVFQQHSAYAIEMRRQAAKNGHRAGDDVPEPVEQ